MQGIFQIIGSLTLPIKERVCSKLKINRSKGLPLIIQYVTTFILINLSWLVFRAIGAIASVRMFKSIFTFAPLSLVNLTYLDILIVGVSLLAVFCVSYYKEKGYSMRDELAKQILPIRWVAFLLLFAATVLFGIYGPGYSDSAFIYMNF